MRRSLRVSPRNLGGAGSCGRPEPRTRNQDRLPRKRASGRGRDKDPIGASRGVDWRDAVKPAQGGVSLDVEVVPGARESRFPAGFNEWRGRIEAKVRAPPEDGQANAELTQIVAAALGVPAASVRVTSGATSRRKTLFVAGLAKAAAERALAGRF
jgi:uncharacterized protein